MTFRKTRKEFDDFTMDDTWQELGRISSENLFTFLALSKSEITLYNKKTRIVTKYCFKKNSQISIQKNQMVFHTADLHGFSSQSLQD